MTYPQYPAQGQPAPQYPPAQPQQGYPSPYPQQGAPMNPYPQQGQPQGPYAPAPGGFPGQYSGQPEAPAPAPIQGTLAAFLDQPSSGFGGSIQFQNDGDQRFLIVARDCTDQDTEQPINQRTNAPAQRADGRPQFTLKVPVYCSHDMARHTEGQGQLYVKGNLWDQISAAMAAVNESPTTVRRPDGSEGRAVLPRKGAGILVTKTGKRPIPGGGHMNLYTAQYWPAGPEMAAFANQLGIRYPELGAEPEAPSQAPPAPQPAAQPEAQAPAAPPAPPQGAPAAQNGPAYTPAPQQGQQYPAPTTAPQGYPVAPQYPAQPPAPQQGQPGPAPVPPAVNGALPQDLAAQMAAMTGRG